jgi:hypothetical protein
MFPARIIKFAIAECHRQHAASVRSPEVPLALAIERD